MITLYPASLSHTHTQVLGLVVMIIGTWAKVNDKKYFDIADDQQKEFKEVTVLMIVVGVFIFIVGAVGTVGALFAGFVFGRVVLVLVSLCLGGSYWCW